MKCEKCLWNYPQHLLQTMRSSSPDNDGIVVCGICALEITYLVHRIRREKFNGNNAERLRLKALEYREKYPDRAPSAKELEELELSKKANENKVNLIKEQ